MRGIRSGRAGASRLRRRAIGVASVCVAALLAMTAVVAPPAGADDGYAEVDLAVAVTVSQATGVVGDVVTARVTLTNLSAVNSGPATLFAYGSLVSFLGSTGTDAICSTDPYGLFCEVADVPPSGVVTVTLQVLLEYVGDWTVDAGSSVVDGDDPNRANDVAAAAGTTLALPTAVDLAVSPSTVVEGRPVTLSARVVLAAGRPLADATVEILRQRPGEAAPIPVDTVYADADGRVTWQDTPRGRTYYAARVVASLEGATSTSATVGVNVSFDVRVAVSPTAVPPGGRLTMTVSVPSAAAGSAPVIIQERRGSGPWRTVAQPKLTAKGQVSVALGPRNGVGSYAFRAVKPSDADRLAGVGAAQSTVTVVGKGSARAWKPSYGTRTRPARWNPCVVISYQVNPRNMPKHGMADLTEALRRVSQVSGLRFRYAGTTRVTPVAGYDGPGTGRFVVAWSTRAQARGLLHPAAAGVAWTSTRGGSRPRILTGSITMEASFARTAPAGFGAGSPHGMVLMHEIGHLVGMDHTNDRWSVMHPSASLPAAIWGAADRAGLKALGRSAGCLA